MNLNVVSNSEKWGIYIVIDCLSQAGEVLHGSLPVLHQDLRGQLAPQRVQGIPVCRWDLGNRHGARLKPEAHNTITYKQQYLHILLTGWQTQWDWAWACHYLLGFSVTATRCSHISYLYWMNGLNYVILRKWNLTVNEKCLVKGWLAFNKTKFAAF